MGLEGHASLDRLPVDQALDLQRQHHVLLLSVLIALAEDQPLHPSRAVHFIVDRREIVPVHHVE